MIRTKADYYKMQAILLTIGIILGSFILFFLVGCMDSVKTGLIVGTVMSAFYGIRLLWAWIKPL